MKYVIIGFGAAGATAAELLRGFDTTGDITIINGEHFPFYLRLDLEGIFEGKTAEQLQPRPQKFWDERTIKIVQGRVARVDRSNQRIELQSGEQFSYDRLLIATGARPRRLECPGSDCDGVFVYRALDDALAIYERRTKVKKAVIIGGGILGMELCHAAIKFGWQPILLVREDHAGFPLLDKDGGEFVIRKLEAGGVHVILSDEVERYENSAGRLTAVYTRNGLELECQFAAEAIGIQKQHDFLYGTNVLTKGALVVNDRLETPVKNIFAAGDCAIVRVNDYETGCHTWNVAAAQARVAAANMAGQNETWTEGVAFNLDYFFDQEFAILGAWERRHEPNREKIVMATDEYYRAVVTVNGIIESAILVGSRFGDRRIRKLIADQINVAGKVDKIFDENAKPGDFAKG